MNDDDRAADARAAELVLGWTCRLTANNSQSTNATLRAIGDVYAWKDASGVGRSLPAFGSDPAAARALLEAVPAEKRGAVVRKILTAVGSDADQITGGLWEIYADDLYLLLLAPPAAVRDAVVEVMEGEE